MNKKKLLTTLGAITATAVPLVAVVSCGSQKTKHYNLLPTYTGQEDQLIALGIKADYYPLQFNAKKPFEYILNPSKFMVMQDDDFKKKFSQKVKELTPKVQNTTWWNQQGLKDNEQGSDPAYWQKVQGGLLLYEHYLLDDDAKIIDDSIAPKHVDTATVQTNFRASRDPYTRIPKGVFFAWDFSDDEIDEMLSGKENTTVHDNDIVASANMAEGKTPEAPKKGDSGSIKITVKDLKIVKALKAIHYDNKGNGGWTYNDRYFVENFHNMFLDNQQFQSSAFRNWMVDSTEESPYADENLNKGLSEDVQKLFDASTFQATEVALGIGPNSTALPHHPIYEQQAGSIGAAPMFEGAMRDNQLYLFNVASQIDNIVTYGVPYGKGFYDGLPDTISNKDRNDGLKYAQSKEEADRVVEYLQNDALSQEQVKQVKSAFDNAEKITTQLQTRMKDMKAYFDILKLKAGHTEPLKFGVLTIAPGHGQSTIQTMSKYSFLYKELGFAQPVPANIKDITAGAGKFIDAWEVDGETATNKYLTNGKVNGSDSSVTKAIGNGSMFNMDDNGWFWTVGESGDMKADYMDQFKDQFDLGVITARDANYNAEIKGDKTVNMPHAAAMFSAKKQEGDDAVLEKQSEAVLEKQREAFLEKQRVDYDLWNEGLKTPFVMHMILDKVMQQMETWAKDNGLSETVIKNISERDAAKSWGNYFTNEYIS